MTYFDEVKEAAAALAAIARGEEAKWSLARLTYENTFDIRGPRPEGGVPMDVWCRDVREFARQDFALDTGKLYKRIWAHRLSRYPGNDLPPWSEAYDAVRGGSTAERFAAWSGDNVVKQGTPETKVETFRRLAEDPDVRADKEAQSAALDFGVQVYRQREQDVRAHWRADETSERQEERLEEIGTALDLEAACDQYLRAVRHFEAQLAPLLEKELPARAPLDRLRSVLQRTREALDRVDYMLEHGRSDVDTFVASVLHREARP